MKKTAVENDEVFKEKKKTLGSCYDVKRRNFFRERPCSKKKGSWTRDLGPKASTIRGEKGGPEL